MVSLRGKGTAELRPQPVSHRDEGNAAGFSARFRDLTVTYSKESEKEKYSHGGQ